MTALDITKPITTRDGRKVRILCTDAQCTVHHQNKLVTQPIVGIVDGVHTPYAWCIDGTFDPAQGTALVDLINAPAEKKRVKVEVVLLKDSDGNTYAAAWAEHERDFGKKYDNATLTSRTVIEMEYEDTP